MLIPACSGGRKRRLWASTGQTQLAPAASLLGDDRGKALVA